MITSHVHSDILGRGCRRAVKPILSPQLPVWLSNRGRWWGRKDGGGFSVTAAPALALNWKGAGCSESSSWRLLQFCHHYTSWGSNKSQPASPAPAHLKLWVPSAMPLNFTISHSASAFLPLSSSNTWLTVLLVWLYIRIILSAKVTGVSLSPDLNLNEHCVFQISLCLSYLCLGAILSRSPAICQGRETRMDVTEMSSYAMQPPKAFPIIWNLTSPSFAR